MRDDLIDAMLANADRLPDSCDAAPTREQIEAAVNAKADVRQLVDYVRRLRARVADLDRLGPLGQRGPAD
jgi:hypothetical protein